MKLLPPRAVKSQKERAPCGALFSVLEFRNIGAVVKRMASSVRPNKGRRDIPDLGRCQK